MTQLSANDVGKKKILISSVASGTPGRRMTVSVIGNVSASITYRYDSYHRLVSGNVCGGGLISKSMMYCTKKILKHFWRKIVAIDLARRK